MSSKRGLGESSPPLTAAAREALALFDALDAENDNESSREVTMIYRSRTLLAGPSIQHPSRQDSPYVKASMQQNASRTSSISSTGASVAKASTFKPLVPHFRVQPPQVPTTAAPAAPARLLKSVADKYDDAENRAPTLHRLHRAVDVTGDTSISSRGNDSRAPLSRNQGPSRAATNSTTVVPNRLSVKMHTAQNVSRNDEYDESVTTVPSSRTPSQEELLGPSISLHAQTRVLRQRPPSNAEKSHSMKDVASQAVELSSRPKRKRAMRRTEVPPVESEIRAKNSRYRKGPGSTDSPEKISESDEVSKEPKPVSFSSSAQSKSSSRRTRPQGGAESKADAHCEGIDVIEDQTSNSSEEERALLPSAFVTILPKRRAAKKGVKEAKARKDDSADSQTIDETSQYIRENWESSASSSDEEEEGDTDHDDSDGITRTK